MLPLGYLSFRWLRLSDLIRIEKTIQMETRTWLREVIIIRTSIAQTFSMLQRKMILLRTKKLKITEVLFQTSHYFQCHCTCNKRTRTKILYFSPIIQDQGRVLHVTIKPPTPSFSIILLASIHILKLMIKSPTMVHRSSMLASSLIKILVFCRFDQYLYIYIHKKGFY